MNTKREKPVVEVDGYLMRQYQPNANGMLMLWRCADVNKYKCRARGSSLFDSREVAVTNGHNGHLTDPSLATKYRARLTSGLNGKELNKLPRRSGIQQVIHRARKHADGSLVDRRPEHVRFSPFFRRTKDDQQARFFSAPRHMAQVYVIGVHKGRSFLPCAFFVLPGKDQETKHIQKAGLMGVYCNAEVRPLLRYLWALAFLPPEDVLEAYEGLVVSLNALVARDVISQADVQRLNEFIRDYFERTYIRRFNARHVLVDPLFPIATWNVHAAVLEDGARTNNSQEGWNRAFNERFLRSHMKLSQFLIRLRDEEEQARQRIERAVTHPADAFCQRRRPKTIIRDGNIKALVEDYVALPAAQRNRAAMADVLARIQHHLSG